MPNYDKPGPGRPAKADIPEFRFTRAQDRARDMLVSDAVHCALGGGSRSGKTFLLVRQVLIRALKEPNSRHAIFRYRFNAIKQSIIHETLPKVIQLCFPELGSSAGYLNKTDWFMTLPNGSEIWFGGLDDKERTEKILGKEFATIYFNECSQIPWPSITLALTRLAQHTETLQLKAFYDFNPPNQNHWTFLQFVKKLDPVTKKNLPDPENYGFFLINPADNKENLAPGYIKILENLPPAQRDRFLLGKFASNSDASLWTSELIDTTRHDDATPLPEFIRVVVSVDPSGCSGPEDTRSDEIGIIVAALGTDGHGYVFEDVSGKYKPEDWGRIAVDAWERNEGDRVVGENNFGGDMVRATIQAVNPNVPFRAVRATRGKVVRAEPISALYHMGKIHHVGSFPELEDQMCAMLTSGYSGLKSPDRVDALVWALTDLFPSITSQMKNNRDKPTTVNVVTSGRPVYNRPVRARRR